MFKTKMFIRSFWKTFLWLIIISVLSCLPSGRLNTASIFDIPHIDKIVHFIMYAVLAALLLVGLKQYHSSLRPVMHVLCAAFVVVLYGVLMELVQLKLIPSRHGEVADLLFNAAGCMTGLIIPFILLKAKIL